MGAPPGGPPPPEKNGEKKKKIQFPRVGGGDRIAPPESSRMKFRKDIEDILSHEARGADWGGLSAD